MVYAVRQYDGDDDNNNDCGGSDDGDDFSGKNT